MRYTALKLIHGLCLPILLTSPVAFLVIKCFNLSIFFKPVINVCKYFVHGLPEGHVQHHFQMSVKLPIQNIAVVLCAPISINIGPINCVLQVKTLRHATIFERLAFVAILAGYRYHKNNPVGLLLIYNCKMIIDTNDLFLNSILENLVEVF